jgi:hypothetical protein
MVTPAAACDGSDEECNEVPVMKCQMEKTMTKKGSVVFFRLLTWKLYLTFIL